MRSRGIKPGFFANEGLAQLETHARLLFIGLWMLADREGRLEDRPKRIEAEIFPYESVDIEKLLDSLGQPTEGNESFIERYQVCGKHFIQIHNFIKHQYPHKNERASDIPAPDAIQKNTPVITGQTPKITGACPAVLLTAVLLTEGSKDLGEISPEVKPSPIKKAKVETPPSVEIYHRLTNLFPAKAWWKILDEAISDDPDALILWSRVVTGWLGMSWSPKSVKLMLDYFRKRQVPGERDREWIPADNETVPIEITEEQAEANRKRLAEMVSSVTARMAV